MATHQGEVNNIIGLIFLAIGFTTEAIQEIERINVVFDLCLKVTSLISFFVFLVLNWDKIKKKLWK